MCRKSQARQKTSVFFTCCREEMLFGGPKKAESSNLGKIIAAPCKAEYLEPHMRGALCAKLVLMKK